MKYGLGDEVTVLVKGTVTAMSGIDGEGPNVVRIRDGIGYDRVVHSRDEVTLVKRHFDDGVPYIDDAGSIWMRKDKPWPSVKGDKEWRLLHAAACGMYTVPDESSLVKLVRET